MSVTSLDLQGKLPDELIELFKTVNVVAECLSIETFVVGETARDLVLEYGFGIKI